MKSFTARFIFRSVLIVLSLLLTIYLFFNYFADEFIRDVAESHLNLNIRNNNAREISVLAQDGWQRVSIEDATTNLLDLPTDAETRDFLALVVLTDTTTDNYFMLNERGILMTSERISVEGAPEFLVYNGAPIDKRLFFADYYRENRDAFVIDDIVTVHVDERIFYLRAVATDHLEEQEFLSPPTPLTIILFTEVTEMLDFKYRINHMLIIALTLSGIIILTTTFKMSARFKQSIKKLSNYADELGHGAFDATIEPLKYSEFQSLATSMTDMSNMLATYEAGQKQFFQNASHELRTPLMAVQCYSEGILADVFKPNDAAHIINSEIEKMTELVSSILYLSRIDHHTFQLEPTSVNEFLSNCVNQIKILADNNNKNISLTPIEKDLQINVDLSLLDRAVLNVLSNALRYVKTEILISAENYLNRNIFANIKQEMVRIKIFNDGKPIDDKDLPYLFDRFYKGEGGNTGLGLSITKEIIIAFGGDIKVENLENGVCFTVDLPVYQNKNTQDQV